MRARRRTRGGKYWPISPLRFPPQGVLALFRWHSNNGRPFPWRIPDTTPYELLIAEMLLRRTRAELVARIWPTVVQLYPSVRALATARPQELRQLLRPLGFGDMRASALTELARLLIEKHDGNIPTSTDTLMQLPHVGLYSANALAVFAFNTRRAVVDANVIRIYSRMFALTNLTMKSRRSPRVWRFANRLLPRNQPREYNYALLDLGALVCKPRLPRCFECPLMEWCKSPVNREGQPSN